ncbi:MAG: siroheme synthase CysG [Thalassobaculaceae bacterium]|nr:siroheme synthase CysG [Thalassobaculaceae bacterium]
MKTFPMFLKTEGRRIVVVGGGEQAAQKVRLALKTSAEILVVSDAPDAEIADLARQGRIVLHTDGLHETAFENAVLAFVATDDGAIRAAAHALAQRCGVLVNVVDAPDLCDAFTPSIVDRDPVVVAIGTEGTAPVLARGLKATLETMLEPRLGDLAALAGRLRGEAARLDPRRRRDLWRWVFNGAPRALHAAGREREAAALVKDAIANDRLPEDRDHPATGFVSLVGAGPGSRDLITLRGAQRLQEADVIFYDRLVDPDLLELARRDAERIYVGKTPGTAAWPQERINALMVRTARAGRRVVRLKCGDPGIFGRGAEEAASLDEAGINWEIVPGVTAASAAAAATSGFLTERGEADTLVIATGQLRAGDGDPNWASYLLPGTTLALYMAVGAAAKVRANLLAAGVEPDLDVRIVSRAASPAERVVITPLDALADTIEREGVENPAIILIRRPKRELPARVRVEIRPDLSRDLRLVAAV